MLNSKLQEYLRTFPPEFEILIDGNIDFAMQVSYFIKGGTVSGRILITDGKSDIHKSDLRNNELQKKKDNSNNKQHIDVTADGERYIGLIATEPNFDFLETASRNQKGNFYRKYADIMDVDLKTLTKKAFMAKWHCESNTYYRCKERIDKFLLEKDKTVQDGQDGGVKHRRGFFPTPVSEEDKVKITDDIRLGLFFRQILKKYHINFKAYSEIKKSVETEKKKPDADEDDSKDIKKRLKYGKSFDNDLSNPTSDNSGLHDKKDDNQDIPKTAMDTYKSVSIPQKNKKDCPVDKGAMTEEERDRFMRDLISRGF